MAEGTVTRLTLRRAICKDLRMPFFRRIGVSSAIGTGSTASLIKDTKLTQGDHFWDNNWFYYPTTGERSLIRSFQAQPDTFSLETPLATSPTETNAYEIHSIWNADEIHEAINEAIRMARKTFPETLTDETIVICEDTLTYSLSGLTSIWSVSKVYVEQVASIIRGTVTSATGTTVTVPGDLTSVNSNWKVTIYAGTGVGQIRAVTSVAGQDITVPTWTTNPDSTSKFALFNPSDQKYKWELFPNYRLDNEEYPDTLYLRTLRPELYGMRLRIQYLKPSAPLSADTDTTVVPEEYIRMKAASLLHGQLLSSSKIDKDSHYGEYKRLQEEADAYLIRNAPHSPGSQFKTPDFPGMGLGYQMDDPLNWNR